MSSANGEKKCTLKTPEEWWSTSIIEMQPGMIRYRGYAVEELIGRSRLRRNGLAA